MTEHIFKKLLSYKHKDADKYILCTYENHVSGHSLIKIENLSKITIKHELVYIQDDYALISINILNLNYTLRFNDVMWINKQEIRCLILVNNYPIFKSDD